MFRPSFIPSFILDGQAWPAENRGAMMGHTTPLGTTDLVVSRLCLGGNVFGWTADESNSFAVLDAFAAAGGNFIDTADTYSCTIRESFMDNESFRRWMTDTVFGLTFGAGSHASD